MKEQYTRQELEHWIDRVTAVMNIDPERELIQNIIPDEVLKRCNDNDVVEAAAEKGCMVYRCYMDGRNFRANGKWVESNRLGLNLSAYRNLNTSLCPECERGIIAKLESGETGFLF